MASTTTGASANATATTSSTSSSALPLIVAFVQLCFNIILPMTMTSGNAGTGTRSSDDKEEVYCKRTRQPNLITGSEMDRGVSHAGADPEELPSSSDAVPGESCEWMQPTTQQFLDAPPNNTADYEEQQQQQLQFYGQLRKLLDLPFLFAICFAQLISFVLVLNIEECSPLVLFSWWRNKIS